MDYMPFFFDLKGKDCLIVGGGGVATRKARLLASAGARLRVIAPRIGEEMQQLVERSQGQSERRKYQPTDLDAVVLVIGATNDTAVNQQISMDAQRRSLPVNIVDSPKLCTIITPAIVDRSPLVVAIGSGGRAPVLARQLRGRIERMIPAAYGQLASLAESFRAQVKQRLPEEGARLRFWERIFTSDVAEKVFDGKMPAAQQRLEAILAEEIDKPLSGEVYLVGGGPGDPDLLTVKALRLMQQADVVLYDRLVSAEVLNLVRRDAERIYVGKRKSEHAIPQPEINQWLVDLAREGKRVLRLKGGDPFIFGRGGEEIEGLAQYSIPFQVVPGITAASGCAAYAGIPLTHRDYAQSVRFITGHTKNAQLSLPWASLLDPHQTLVFYMGLAHLPLICRELIHHGRKPDTPVALVEKGTIVSQRVLIGTLENMPAQVQAQQMQAPTLLIIGDVVRLHQRLNWYGDTASSL